MDDFAPERFLNTLQVFGWRLGLQNITTLLERIGAPHKRLKCVHIAGTNGKGSTAAMLASILRCAGYKTGLYTSPHLVTVTERIQIDGTHIPAERFAAFLQQWQDEILAVGNTYFETLTALAFWYFAQEDIDIAVVEVGLGGRLDATNVIHPLLSIITDISLEHTEHLGKTLRAIATEKAGIVKTEIQCLLQSRKDEVVESVATKCTAVKAPLIQLADVCRTGNVRMFANGVAFDLETLQRMFRDLRSRLSGTFQVTNAATAVTAALLLEREEFKVREAAIRDGLRLVDWPGRLQHLQDAPCVVADVAHEPAALSALLADLAKLFRYRRFVLLFGVLQDKAITEMIKEFGPRVDHAILVQPASNRAMPASELAALFRQTIANVDAFETVAEGVAAAFQLAGSDDLICVTGSHHTVGDFLTWYRTNKMLDK